MKMNNFKRIYIIDIFIYLMLHEYESYFLYSNKYEGYGNETANIIAYYSFYIFFFSLNGKYNFIYL